MKLGRLVPIERAAGAKWAIMQRYEIPCPNGEPYLERLRIVQSPIGGAYVHWFVQADDVVPHDHPWSFVSLLLRGGYTEELHDGPIHRRTVERRRWSVAFRRSTDSHRISSADHGTMTLVLVGPRRRTWGFWTDAGWVPWTEHERTSA